MPSMTEELLETKALAWFADLNYQTLHGPDLAPDGSSPEREDYRQTILVGRTRQVLERINPGVSAEGIDDAIRRILNTPSPDVMTNSRALHRLLPYDVDVTDKRAKKIAIFRSTVSIMEETLASLVANRENDGI